MKNIDLLAIGDIAIDNFIKINDAEASCDTEGVHCKLCLNYGGKIPYESSTVFYAVGNSANVAVGTSRLGLNTLLMSNIGDNQDGFKCLDVLKNEKVDTSFIKIEKDKATNYHYVLWYNTERTILTKHENYNYEWMNAKESYDYKLPLYIYLSSLGENSLDFHKEIFSYLEKHDEVKFVFQPGTFQIKMGIQELKDIYVRTDIFISNKEEAERILNQENNDIKSILKSIHDLGPKIVIITDRENGAYSYDGNEFLHIDTLADKIIESTGAGDAFSAGFVSALLKRKGIKDALVWGSINAKSVVLDVGPQRGLLNEIKILEEADLYIDRVESF